MRISYNWLKEYITLNKTPEEVSSILTDIGLEVEHLERVHAVPGNLEGLVVGEILSCGAHPDADRLKQTTVDVGEAAPLSIVCGAPNVAQGQKVIVAKIGAVLHPQSGEPFKIKKSKIRGIVSEGMICAEDEIGLGKSHNGIMVLDAEAPIGQQAADYFELEDSVIFEIGLTPNRSDAVSHYGVARDLAAYLRGKVSLPEVWEGRSASVASPFTVQVEDPLLCPRYTSVVIRDVQVGESPEWLKERLHSIGLRSINNIVDITNFVMHELGQPLHAFDADKIAGHTVFVKAGMDGPFITLDQESRVLDPADLMITDASGPLCMAGVMGGLNSGVTEQTRQVFLESAYFNPVSIRKASKRHGLKSDSSFRFERGVDPNMTELALRRAVLLIQELAGGTVETAISDIYPVKIKGHHIEVNITRMQNIIGKEISQAEIESILQALEIKVISVLDDTLRIEVPTYRGDVRREIDIVEEILRIYGYNNIEFSTQIKSSLHVSDKPDPEATQHTVADLLVSNGFYEIMNNSLTKAAFLKDSERAVQVLNPLSGDLAVMRQNLLFSILETVSYNQKRKQHRLALFEFGRAYFKEAEGYKEQRRLGIAMNGINIQPHWSEKPRSFTFYDLKGIVVSILSRLGIASYHSAESEATTLQYGLEFTYKNKPLVTFGQVHSDKLEMMDVDGPVYYAEFYWDDVLKSLGKHKLVFQEVPKFPLVKRDLSLLIDESVTFDQLRKIAVASDKKLLKEVNIFDVYKGKSLPAGKKSYALSFIFQDENKTLKDKQIDSVVQKLIVNFEREAGAEVRK